MCYIWQNPTLPKEEVTLETLEKIPSGIDYLNLTGGEPTLRNDLEEIVDLLYPKAMQLEISSNGLHANRIEPIIKKYPNVKIRFSLEGFEATNTKIRGEDDGFHKKVNGLLRLRELGGIDLGFAITIQDDNVHELTELFRFARKNEFELATSTLHNGFQFHKSDNVLYDRLQVAASMEDLVTEQLKTRSIKNWFRAYLNMGLISKALGHPRLIPCTAATDFVFVDPWSDVYACNVRPDLNLGNLRDQSWSEIYYSSKADFIRKKVAVCDHNCWMVGSAKTAMRHPKYARIPKGGPLWWVIQNKFRVTIGKPIPFSEHINYDHVHQDAEKPQRPSFIGKTVKRTIETAEVHYQDEYFNI